MGLMFVAILAFAASCSASFFSSPVEEYSEKYNWQPTIAAKDVRQGVYTQWVDHYERGATFDQKVYINDQYYFPGGPVLIFVSAHNDAYEYWLQNSHMVNIADQLGGVIYALEPRFFGSSIPTENTSLSNFEQFFHLNQTMADYSDFITFLRQELSYFGSDKFVLIGHGRGGALASWIHHRYPNLANGVWAASSPIVTLFDFAFYYYGMSDTFEKEFPASCQQTIFEAFEELENLVESQDLDRLHEIFVFNSDLDLANTHDVALFYRQLFESLFSPVEYGTPGTIEVICNQLVPSPDFTSLELLGHFYGGALNNRIFKYDTLVSLLKEESVDAARVINSDRQKLYIGCSSWALFKTSSYLPVPVNRRFEQVIFGDICDDVFGISLEQAHTNNYFTNQENMLNSNIPNVYFTNAEFDPHRIVGVTGHLNPSSPAVVIPRIGKLYDFFRTVYPDSYTPELQEARNLAYDLIRLWT